MKLRQKSTLSISILPAGTLYEIYNHINFLRTRWSPDVPRRTKMITHFIMWKFDINVYNIQITQYISGIVKDILYHAPEPTPFHSHDLESCLNEYCQFIAKGT